MRITMLEKLKMCEEHVIEKKQYLNAYAKQKGIF